MDLDLDRIWIGLDWIEWDWVKLGWIDFVFGLGWSLGCGGDWATNP